MPTFDFECKPCGRRWTDLVPAGATSPCPGCGEPREHTFGRMSDSRVLTRDEFDHPLETKFARQNKEKIEAESERILSGEVAINECGPKQHRPQCPEHLRKRYF